MKKRVFAVLLALCLALALVPMSAFAADDDDFTIKKGVLTEYNGSGGDVVIPESVTVIGEKAFEDCLGLTSVTFPSKLTAIGSRAFFKCVSLSSITLPNSVVSLGGGAFQFCTGLGNVTLSSNLKSIPTQAFQGCSGISSIEFPASVSSIGYAAFADCTGLSKVTFLNANPVIDTIAFFGAGLTDVYYVGTQEQWDKLSISNGNEPLVNAKIHCNSTGPSDTPTPDPEPTPTPTPTPDPEPSTDPGTTSVKVTGVNLSRTELTMDPGQSETLTATVSPAAASNKAVTWSTNNAAVATVTSGGRVSAVAAGTAEITVTTADGGYTAACQVCVIEEKKPVTGVKLSKTALTMDPGQSETLTATVSPAAASNKAVTWSTNNAAVATVTSSGRVSALSAGAAVITARTDDGGYTAQCRVIVNGESKPAAVEVHFSHTNVYNQGQFSDVPADQWYTDGVKQAFEFGLMNGVSARHFDPQGNVTIAQAITMAARFHSIYTTGSESFKQGDPWYQVYLDYAFQNGIISYAFYNADVTKNATRAQFAEIFANALPEEALAPANDVVDGAIPDVPMTEAYAAHVYKLYRAGILNGSDVNGTFFPASYITRQEAATIVSRMAESGNRKTFTL